MPTYSVNFINNSQNQGSACLFQQSSSPSYGQVFSLAWFANPSFPGSQNSFQWNLDYSFVWGETGMLMPGITFQAAQMVNADPNGSNTVTFGQYGSPGFGPVQGGGQPGMLSIRTGMIQQQGQLSVGIGMSGSGTFATQAQSNMMYTFASNPNYWLTFGNYQQGQVLDVNSISNSVQLNFGSGTSLTVTLNPNGTFTVGS